MKRKLAGILILLIAAFFLLDSRISLAANPEVIRKAIMKLLGVSDDAGKTVPKHADELAPKPKAHELHVKPLKFTDLDIISDGKIVTRGLGKSTHAFSCPGIKLRVSLPQLNARISSRSKMSIRAGPGTQYEELGHFMAKGDYIVDLLEADGCWLEFRAKDSEGKYATGWVSPKYLEFTFDDHLKKPTNYRTRSISRDSVYNLVSENTYQIMTPTSLGTAVAISPSVLLTNCHVLGANKFVFIVEGRKGYRSRLIHDEHSKDKCFIRSFYYEVRPISGVLPLSSVTKGDKVYAIGSPLGRNRTITEGQVFAARDFAGNRWLDATAQVEPGSSGGGLFDDKGNLLGITTLKRQTYEGFTDSSSIVAEDFWR